MVRSNHSPFVSGLSRREWLKLSTAGVIGYSMSGWLGTLAASAANDPERRDRREQDAQWHRECGLAPPAGEQQTPRQRKQSSGS